MRTIRTSMSLCLSVLIGLSVLLFAPPASAATCAGPTCVGKAAAAEGCTTGAYIIAGFTLNDPNVTQQAHGDLWYSPVCEAMWGDFNVPELIGAMFGQLWTQPEYGGVNQLAGHVRMSGPNWTTTMVDWQQSVKLCGSHKDMDPDMDLPSQGYNACTGWR